ncbi:hypothetical protein KM043_011250 [Ampulex compressa]|nr:hypothetical protein KM043_011250 [Ampulex compressa]
MCAAWRRINRTSSRKDCMTGSKDGVRKVSSLICSQRQFIYILSPSFSALSGELNDHNIYVMFQLHRRHNVIYRCNVTWPCVNVA